MGLQTKAKESEGHDKGRGKQEKAGDHKDKENKGKHEKDKEKNKRPERDQGAEEERKMKISFKQRTEEMVICAVEQGYASKWSKTLDTLVINLWVYNEIYFILKEEE